MIMGHPLNRHFKSLLQFPGLAPEQNQIFRNFNVLLLIGLADIVILCAILAGMVPRWPFYVCLGEGALLVVLLALHLRGYFVVTRLSTFLAVISLQIVASVVHGPSAGFEHLFYPIAVLPMLFFERAMYYVPMFALAAAALLGVHYHYQTTAPLIVIDSPALFYWNLFVTAAIIFAIMAVFKKSYERSRSQLKLQNEQILQQKEEIEGINNNLEQILRQRTEVIRSHELRFTQYAFVHFHQVRGSLARFMGLLHLIDLEKDKPNALQEYLPALKSNASDLNRTLQEVSSTLNDIAEEEQHLPTPAAAATAKAATATGEAAAATTPSA
jgi:hypothetical protein